MARFDTRLTLWKGQRKLLAVDHSGETSARIEIDACKSRIRRGEATHIDIESISAEGAEYVEKLRDYARCA